MLHGYLCATVLRSGAHVSWECVPQFCREHVCSAGICVLQYCRAVYMLYRLFCNVQRQMCSVGIYVTGSVEWCVCSIGICVLKYCRAVCVL